MSPRLSLSLLLLTLLSLPSPAGAAAPDDGAGFTETYRLHLRSKPAVVRILDGYKGYVQYSDGSRQSLGSVGSGSGFFISSDGYIMTNAHVVSATRDGESAARETLYAQFVSRMLQANNLQPTRENIDKVNQWARRNGVKLVISDHLNLVLLQDGSALRYEIKAYGVPVGSRGDQLTGKDVAILKVETRNAPTLQLGDSSRVRVGDRVHVVGYPGAADSDVLDERSKVEPTINEGAISAIKTTVDGIPVLQTNTSATHGNSGGPVLNRQAEVIGLLTFRGDTVNGQEVQGFNFIVPSNTAREYLAPAGASNAPGLVDQRWIAGLAEYEQRHYRKAKQFFDEVATLSPQHSEARRLLVDSQERILRGEDVPDTPPPPPPTPPQPAPQPVVLAAPVAPPAPAPTPAPAESSSIATLVGGALLLLSACGGVAAFVLRRRAQGTATRAAPPVAAAAGAAPPRRGRVLGGPTVAATTVSPALAAAGLTLRFDGGPLSGQAVTVPEAGLWIGRDASRAEVVIDDPMISGRHLWVGRQGGQWLIRDERSTNGTFIDSVGSGRITEHVLRPGERIILSRNATASFTALL
ncbi:FHA domain-containing protein [Plasticicumulans lactativorans]|uniref:FHA domain-containing protein n=1 Tax=Plasticicumulans lactativorans TaxID=1133106 RepID=A0A4R2LMN9_9GAMM|nr:trypsin-like peptidase domain-containing protein [Plasticicumulans lactativorans]TCO80725.1 FHA domain-containing protein [Plasticicumulans lactativorans]